LNRDVVEPALRRLVDMVPTSSQELVGGSAVETISVIERLDRDMRKDERPSAVLFGLGNYAKTQILPVIRRQLRLEAIHEVDPDQLATARGFNTTLDTSPRPREGESYDVYFLAGFHHTHAELAVHALRGGGYAVVEKPVATTRRQLQLLKETAMRGVGRGFFACFHKRYSRLDGWAREDLGAGDGKPIDMHALVYEVPIPFHHWYNWPASGSRLVSNGCHWLDYFMWLNAFSPIVESEVHRLRGRDLVVLGRLENDARFVMCLTDTGSSRLGVRDVIELRSGNVTARLIDGTSYVAESSQRVLRRRRTNPIGAYERMYSEICRRIVAGAPGDSVESLRSAEWTLALEDELADDANGHLARGPRLGAG
jgi:predicted dehydrogenase